MMTGSPSFVVVLAPHTTATTTTTPTTATTTTTPTTAPTTGTPTTTPTTATGTGTTGTAVMGVGMTSILRPTWNVNTIF